MMKRFSIFKPLVPCVEGMEIQPSQISHRSVSMLAYWKDAGVNGWSNSSVKWKDAGVNGWTNSSVKWKDAGVSGWTNSSVKWKDAGGWSNSSSNGK